MRCRIGMQLNFSSGTRPVTTYGWWLSCALVDFLNNSKFVIPKFVFYFILAGTLDILLEQDGCLPETSIKMFGADICEGLFYVHSLGVLFCDLIPRKVFFFMFSGFRL